MEASVAGQIQAVAEQPTAPVQPTEPVQPQSTEQVVTESSQGEEGDLRSAFEDMKGSFDRFLEQQKPAEEGSLATDLLSHLEGQTGDEPEQQVEPQAGEGPEAQHPGLQSPEAQAQMEEAKALIASVVQEQVTPLQQELAARDMKALADRYPDINSKEVLSPLTNQINELVALTGNPDLIYNAQIVERLYKVVKAEQADATAVPAEQAATQGASLETHAGQTQAGDPSLSDQYKQEVYKRPTPSAFG
jgi:hypothetical protein